MPFIWLVGGIGMLAASFFVEADGGAWFDLGTLAIAVGAFMLALDNWGARR